MDETWLTSSTFNADDDKSSFGHFCLIFWGKNGPFLAPKWVRSVWNYFHLLQHEKLVQYPKFHPFWWSLGTVSSLIPHCTWQVAPPFQTSRTILSGRIRVPGGGWVWKVIIVSNPTRLRLGYGWVVVRLGFWQFHQNRNFWGEQNIFRNFYFCFRGYLGISNISKIVWGDTVPLNIFVNLGQWRVREEQKIRFSSVLVFLIDPPPL